MDIAAFVIILLGIFCILVTSIVKPTFKIQNVKLSLYWIIALIVAIVLLTGTFLPIDEFWNGLIANEGMNPLKILVLFLSMTCISLFLDELGFFSYLAAKVLKKTNSSQFKIFIALYILISILTIFTSNDIIVLTLTPFIISFCKRANISPIPYLVSEFIAANTWSMIFIIGNPTNIYIASSFNIDFVSYLKVMAVPTILAGLLEFGLLILIFWNKLKETIVKSDLDVQPIDKTITIIGLSILAICTILLIVSSYVRILEMWYVALGSLVLLSVVAIIYFIINNKAVKPLTQTFKKAPYELIPFLLSMFVVALTLKHYGFTNMIHDAFGESNANIIYGYSSLAAANLVNNIPMSVIYSNIIPGLSGQSLELAIYSSVIGSNIGAFLTPLGALAGIMWMNILKEHNIKYSFLDFVKYGIVVGLPVATVAIVSLPIFIK